MPKSCWMFFWNEWMFSFSLRLYSVTFLSCFSSHTRDLMLSVDANTEKKLIMIVLYQISVLFECKFGKFDLQLHLNWCKKRFTCLILLYVSDAMEKEFYYTKLKFNWLYDDFIYWIVATMLISFIGKFIFILIFDNVINSFMEFNSKILIRLFFVKFVKIIMLI